MIGLNGGVYSIAALGLPVAVFGEWSRVFLKGAWLEPLLADLLPLKIVLKQYNSGKFASATAEFGAIDNRLLDPELF